MDEVNVGKTAMPHAVTLRLQKDPGDPRRKLLRHRNRSLPRGLLCGGFSGAYDICLAFGVEKLKDTGYGGLPGGGSSAGSLLWQWWPNLTAPGSFRSACVRLWRQIQGSRMPTSSGPWRIFRQKATTTASLNPKAHLQQGGHRRSDHGIPHHCTSHWGCFDCCGVSDGSACAIVTTPGNR
jgi:acetyl-CoA C-acetyltransferase